MIGLYIHIPFCKQACSYCDFHFSTNLTRSSGMVDAICKELEARSSETTSPISTVYFGGGSPSILSETELAQIVQCIKDNYDVSSATEFTLESNPDDHSIEKLSLWKSHGVNRLSVGIQSFVDRDLAQMNRAHNALEAHHCVEKARSAGFDSLSIDLIYGIPGQSMDEWLQNIQTAIELNTDHISAYCLTIEPKTALMHQLKAGKVSEKDDDVIQAEYDVLCTLLRKAGYEHYEISNFSKVGKRALHNTSYWKSKPYIGVGPSAHSFDGDKTRRWNVSNNVIYTKAVAASDTYWEEETLSETDIQNESVMIGLRRTEGITRTKQLDDKVAKLHQSLGEMLWVTDSHIGILEKHWLRADAIIRELFE